MNDRTPARGGGDEHRRRPYELLACTLAFEVAVFARRLRSAFSKLLARVGVATVPRDVGVRAVNTAGNLWQVTHTLEVGQRIGDRT
jgi:hypothetical protein